MVNTDVIYWDEKDWGERVSGEKVDSKNSGGCDMFEISLANSSEDVK